MTRRKRMSEGDWVALRLLYLMLSTDPSWASNAEVSKAASRYRGREKELDLLHKEYRLAGFLKHSPDVASIRNSKSL